MFGKLRANQNSQCAAGNSSCSCSRTRSVLNLVKKFILVTIFYSISFAVLATAQVDVTSSTASGSNESREYETIHGGIMSIPRQETIHGDSNALTITSDRRQKHGDPAWVPFAAGFTSGCTNVLAGHPFDTLRVRVQTGQSIAFTNPYHYAAMLYRGILPPFITASMSISVNFGLWEAVRTTYTDPWITKSNKPLSPDESPVSSIFLRDTKGS